MMLSSLILPILLVCLSLYGLMQRKDVYDALIRGAESGLRVVCRILPALVILLSAVSMFRSSGAMLWISRIFGPLFTRLGIPPETISLMLIRPLSGSGALAAASDLIASYGPDSRIGRTAAVMMGSTETTFYTVAVYFGAAGIHKTRHTIPAALIADLTGFVTAAMTVRLFYGH